MAATRVKESCLPCRRRKTRCDDSQPCSSCVLRRTESDCRPGTFGQQITPARASVPGGSAYPTYGSRAASPSPRLAPNPSNGYAASGLAAGGTGANGSTAKRRRTSVNSPRASGGYSGVSPAQTQQALNEVARLRASVNALEGQIYGIQAGLQRTASPYGGNGDGQVGDADGSPRELSEERERWEKVWASLPDMCSCEMLLEYLIQECDFLYLYGDILDTWLTAVRTRSLSETQAGRICMAFAIAALLLGQGAHPYYRPNCDPVALNQALWDLGQLYVSNNPTTVEEVEVLVDVTRYLVFSGRHMPMLMHMPMLAMKGALRIGLFDECHQSWEGLTEMQRERRRQIAADMVGNCRWSCLVVKEDPLKYIKVNFCQPTFYNVPLENPIRSIPADDPHLQAIFGGDPEPDFRLFRLKSGAERDRSRQFTKLINGISDMLPRVKSLHTQMQQPNQTPSSVEGMAHLAAGIYDELCYWLDTKLPDNGLGDPAVEDVVTTDMARCKRAAQSLIVHHAVTYIASAVLRPWLTAGDRGLAPDSVQKRMHDACLVNADRVMESIPVIKALLATRTQPVITPWSASNLFAAAMAYAVPLLRSVQKWTGGGQSNTSTEDDIRRLSTWAGPHDHVGGPAQTAERDALLAEEKPIPFFMYGDEVVRTCANNILKVLDILSILKVSPLGATAEEKLRKLIKKYGLQSPGHSPESLMAGAYSYGLPQLASMGGGGPGENNGPPAGFGQGGGGNPAMQWGGVVPSVVPGGADGADAMGRGTNGLMQLAIAGLGGSDPTPPQRSAYPSNGVSSSSGMPPTPSGYIPYQGGQDLPSYITTHAIGEAAGASAAGGGTGSAGADTAGQAVAGLNTGAFGLPMEQPDWSWFGFEPGLSDGPIGGDPALLDQLLQLDSSVWQGLLDPTTGTGI